MEIQLWRELLHPYEQAVSELIVKFNSLKMEFSKNSLYSPIESVQGRVKTVSSILEKMKKKGIPFEHLEDMVEDIAGIRIICQFVEDIEKVSTLIRMRSDMEVLQQKNYLENKKGKRIPQLSSDCFLCRRDDQGTEKDPCGDSNPHYGDEFLGNNGAFSSV